jgi:hypothetical protein
MFDLLRERMALSLAIRRRVNMVMDRRGRLLSLEISVLTIQVTEPTGKLRIPIYTKESDPETREENVMS